MIPRRPSLTDEQRQALLKIFEMPIGADAFALSSLMNDFFEWDKWRVEIPYLSFPTHWEVKMVPPFAAAIVRFFVRLPTTPEDERVSVYLDCYDHLGWFGAPYWEIYPHDGDTYRCAMNETKDLLFAIEHALVCLEPKKDKS